MDGEALCESEQLGAPSAARYRDNESPRLGTTQVRAALDAQLEAGARAKPWINSAACPCCHSPIMHLSCAYSLAKPCEISAGAADCFSGRVQSFRHYARSPPAPLHLGGGGLLRFGTALPSAQLDSLTECRCQTSRLPLDETNYIIESLGPDGDQALCQR